MKIHLFVLTNIVLFLSLSSWAQPQVQIEIEIGQGQARITSEGLDDNEKRKLETEILIDESLSDQVNAQEKITLRIELSEDQLKSEELDLRLFVNKVQKQMNLPVQDPTEFSGSRRVVMGSHMVIEKDEHLEEVVVMAGSADIYGKVDRLIVFGGNVTLHGSAEVIEELDNIGGYIDTKDGARIRGRSVEMDMPISDRTWSKIFDSLMGGRFGEFSDRSRTIGWYIFRLFIIGILLLAMVVGDYIAPKFQDSVQIHMREKPGQAVIWGVISGVVLMPITILLMISVVGIPLMPLQFSLAFAFVLLGWGHGSHAVMFFLSKKVPLLATWHRYGLIVLGFVILECVAVIPFIGPLMKWGLVLSGFGAVSKEFYTRVLSRPEKRTT